MTGTGIRRTRIVCKLHFIIINLPTVWLFRSIFGQFSKTLSRSAHRIPNFTNPAYFVCLLYEYFFQIKVLNWYHNTPKNANITRCIKKKTLTNSLNWGNWISGFVKLGDRWAERDTQIENIFGYLKNLVKMTHINAARTTKNILSSSTNCDTLCLRLTVIKTDWCDYRSFFPKTLAYISFLLFFLLLQKISNVV